MKIELNSITGVSVAYAGCGTHELQVTLEFDEDEESHFASQLRRIAGVLSPDAGVSTLVQEALVLERQRTARLREAVDAVLRFYEPPLEHTPRLLATALASLEAVYEEVGGW